MALALWFATMVAVGAGLLARHAVALPAPADLSKLGASVDALRTPETRGRWLAVHVLYAECACSQRIVAHLVAGERREDWAEVVLWAGSLPPSSALVERFDVRRVREADLAGMGIESAPLLIAADPEGHVVYAAGYTDRKQGPSIEDARILASARRTGRVASLPILGCAVSARLQQTLRSLTIL